MELWAGGNFSAAFDMEMAVKNAGATGACSVYASIIELDYEQIAKEEEDAKPDGPQTLGESSAS